VLTHDVGGGFGMKAQAYPKYAAILYAARKVGRPVKWCWWPPIGRALSSGARGHSD